MIALTFEQYVTIFGIVMTVLGVIGQAIYLVRRFTQQEERTGQQIAAVKVSVEAAGEQSTADMKHLAETQAAAMKGLEDRATKEIVMQNQITSLRFDELGRRVGRVEQTLGSITKVVVFSEGKTT